jgi:hypothetical protein
MLLHNYFVMIGFDSKFKGIQNLLKMDLENQIGKKTKHFISHSLPPIRPAGLVGRAGPHASPSARAPFSSFPPFPSRAGPC